MKTVAVFLVSLLTLPVTADEFDRFGSGGNQFDVEFVSVGNPGNTADTVGMLFPVGSVEYSYRIGRYEISENMIDKANAQSAADGNPLGLTHDGRGANKPATSLSWLDATRFVNWLNTSSGYSPAYKFDQAGRFQTWDFGDVGYDPDNRFRNRLAQYFLPSVDEWHKAAYYDPLNDDYYIYPTSSNAVPDGIDFIGDTVFDAVYDDGAHNAFPNDITDVGVFSPYGTAGQGGNVWEYEESEWDFTNDSATSARGIRGGKWKYDSEIEMSSSHRANAGPGDPHDLIGFRIASKAVPEPGISVFGAIAMLGLLTLRRRSS